MKDRTNVIRGFKNMEDAQLLTDAWLIHYNHFKEHESLGNVPPAQKMDKVPFKDWNDVIRAVNKDMVADRSLFKVSRKQIRVSKRMPRITPKTPTLK